MDIFVVEVDSEQAMATSPEQARELVLEKFKETLDKAFKPADRPSCNDPRKRIYFNAEVTEHEAGKTGWTKTRR